MLEGLKSNKFQFLFLFYFLFFHFIWLGLVWSMHQSFVHQMTKIYRHSAWSKWMLAINPKSKWYAWIGWYWNISICNTCVVSNLCGFYCMRCGSQPIYIANNSRKYSKLEFCHFSHKIELFYLFCWEEELDAGHNITRKEWGLLQKQSNKSRRNVFLSFTTALCFSHKMAGKEVYRPILWKQSQKKLLTASGFWPNRPFCYQSRNALNTRPKRRQAFFK